MINDNPYVNTQETVSLKIKHLSKTNNNFKFYFVMDSIGCSDEPMYEWLVNTRKLASGIKKDKDRSLLRNQKRDKSWIGLDYGYWSGITRYFVIGYAIDFCKVHSAGLKVDLERLVSLFSNEALHAEMIESFINDFFHNEEIDIYSSTICTSSKYITHKSLKQCFMSGYRLCADIYIALQQAEEMGPVSRYIDLLETCRVLGFDELPLWYIRENNNHYLYEKLKQDVLAQRSFALWGFVDEGDGGMLVAESNPYGVSMGYGVSRPQSHVTKRGSSSRKGISIDRQAKKRAVTTQGAKNAPQDVGVGVAKGTTINNVADSDAITAAQIGRRYAPNNNVSSDDNDLPITGETRLPDMVDTTDDFDDIIDDFDGIDDVYNIDEPESAGKDQYDEVELESESLNLLNTFNT